MFVCLLKQIINPSKSINKWKSLNLYQNIAVFFVMSNLFLTIPRLFELTLLKQRQNAYIFFIHWDRIWNWAVYRKRHNQRKQFTHLFVFFFSSQSRREIFIYIFFINQSINIIEKTFFFFRGQQRERYPNMPNSIY